MPPHARPTFPIEATPVPADPTRPRPTRAVPGRGCEADPGPACGATAPPARPVPAAGAASAAGGVSLLEYRVRSCSRGRWSDAGMGRTAGRGQSGLGGSVCSESGVWCSGKCSWGLKGEPVGGILVLGELKNIWLCFSARKRLLAAKGRGWGCRERRAAVGSGRGAAFGSGVAPDGGGSFFLSLGSRFVFVPHGSGMNSWRLSRGF